VKKLHVLLLLLLLLLVCISLKRQIFYFESFSPISNLAKLLADIAA
jgi:hypothetical protein